MVWARVMASHQYADGFSISIDEGKPHQWDIKPQAHSWVWDAPTVEQDGKGGPLLFHLDAGQHTLHLGNREDGTKIDRLVIQYLPFDTTALAELVRTEHSRLRKETVRLLVHLKDKRAIIPLRAMLKNDDTNIRLSAIRSLATLRDVDGLIEALNHDDAQIRRSVVLALKSLSDARAVLPLCDMLKDSDKEVRWQTLLALEALGDERAVAPLIEHVEMAEDERESIHAAIFLGAFGKPEAMDVVVPFLYRPDTINDIANVLGELRNREAIEPLTEFLHDGSARVRFEVSVALGRLRAVETVGDLRELMNNDPDPLVRLGAADALYCMGEEDGLETLRTMGSLVGTDWHLIGPFHGLEKQGIHKVYPPEKEIDLNGTYSGKSGPIRWQKLKERELGALIDLRMFLASNSDAVVYGVTAVDVPTERPAELQVRNDDDMKVWLNGVLVSSHRIHGQVTPKRIPVQLKQGRNVILVKVQNNMTLGYFQVNLTNERGKGFPDVTYAAPIESPLAFPTPPPPEGEKPTSALNLQKEKGKAYFFLPAVESPDYRLSVYASGMPTLTALALAPDGMLYAASKEAGSIYQIRPDTSWREFAEVPSPRDLTCAPDGTLYVTSGQGKKSGVFQISAKGEKQLIAFGFDGFDTSLHFVPRLLNPAPQATQPKGFAVPAAIDISPDGMLFVADSFAGRIYAVTADGKVTPRVEGLASPLGPICLAFAPDRTLYFVEGETDRLFMLKKDGEPTEIDWDVTRAAHIAFDTKGTLFATVPSTGKLLSFNSDGKLTVLVRGLSQPSGIAINQSGTIFVTNESQILRLTR